MIVYTGMGYGEDSKLLAWIKLRVCVDEEGVDDWGLVAFLKMLGCPKSVGYYS